MGWWRAVASAFSAGRDSKRRNLSVGGAAAVAVGALLTWLAGRRRAIPPVRATGVAENAIHTSDSPPRES